VFAVAADTSWSADQPPTLKSDDAFAIFGRFGDMEGGAEGVYYRDTRHMSRLAVTLSGARPRLLSAAISTDNSKFTCDLACQAPVLNPDMGDDGNEILLRRETFLWDGARHDRLRLRNFSKLPQTVAVDIGFAADFADLFEIRGTARALHGTMRPPVCTADHVQLACLGRDGVLRETALQFTPAPASLTASHVGYDVTLAPGGGLDIGIATTFNDKPCAPFAAAAAAARLRQRAWRRNCGAVATGNSDVDTALRRARDDLIMLTTGTDHGPYPYAGVPWFSTTFGRDGIITALQVMAYAPDLARGVLGFLAANQATRLDPVSDAEPGKILHEARDGDMANCGEVPFRRYYGSVDATPLFVMLAGAYFDRTGDLAFLRSIWPNIAAALTWIDTYGDADGDGFIEYFRKSASGLANQGWKDSKDSVFHQDGALAQGPIALCEVQAYSFGAKCAAARIEAAFGHHEHAAALQAQADTLRLKFDAAFWDHELGFYVLALDGQKAPCRVLASNAGHTLFTGIALPGRAALVADRLMGATFFSGWGIRTLAQGQPRYNPMSYHNGSVWPHDNALIGLGLARYGRQADAARLFDAMLATAGFGDRFRLPELFCGLPRRGAGTAPTAYPVACAPQAWAAGALPALLAACCGLTFNGGNGTARAVTPVLPRDLSTLHFSYPTPHGQRDIVSVRRDPVGHGTAA
jgi:glycogen debranching enzyme